MGKSKEKKKRSWEEEEQEESTGSNYEIFRLESKAVGDQKTRMKYKKREYLRWLSSPEAFKGVENRLKGIKVNMKALEPIASTADARITPPHNMEATEAEMAYPLDKIIRKWEWCYLQDIFVIVHGGSELSPDVYPSFVCNRVHKLQNAKDESSSRRIAGILSFITHLIHFKNLYSMREDDKDDEDGELSAKHHELPTSLLRRFTAMFATCREDWHPAQEPTIFIYTRDRWIPSDKLNLLISYVLVLSLFVDDFYSDPSDIANDLGMNPLTLRAHYVYLGCKFVRENQLMVATLPVPLEFQTVKREKRRNISQRDH